MNSVTKFFLVSGLIVGFGALIQALIPDQLTGNINNAVIYWLTQTAPLNNLFHISTFFACIQILGNFAAAIGVFIMARWIIHIATR